jgi:hypothetical protein
MDQAFERAGVDDPSVVVDAVVDAIVQRRPPARRVVGKGTGPLLFLARLPARARDRLVKRALGLTDELAAGH